MQSNEKYRREERIRKLNAEKDFKQHDGFYVDYKQFGEITKEVLKNANVLREKSPHSPSPLKANASSIRLSVPDLSRLNRHGALADIGLLTKDNSLSKISVVKSTYESNRSPVGFASNLQVRPNLTSEI